MATAASEIDNLIRTDSVRRRHVLQRNTIHKSTQEATNKSLEAQRRSKQMQLSKEERDLRAQLHRLQDEQRALAEASTSDLEAVSYTSIYVDEDFGSSFEPDDVINPYPVTIGSNHRTRKISAPSRHGNPGLSLYHSRRRGSVEFEDLELQASTGSIQLPHLQRTTSSRNLLIPPGLTSELSHTDSFWSLKSVSPKEREGNFWVGDPEAISSIRRPRKSPGRQGGDHTWSRSRSLKEKPAASIRSDSSTRISRSHSMRESVRKSPQPPVGGRSPQPCDGPVHAWSRSNSLKEARGNTRSSVGSPDEGAAALTGSRRRTKSFRVIRNRLGGSSHSSKSSLADVSTSPDTKSAVWGFLDDDCESSSSSIISASSVSLRSTRGRQRRTSETNTPVTIILDASPPLPPIAKQSGDRDEDRSTPSPPHSRSPPLLRISGGQRKHARSPLASESRQQCSEDKVQSVLVTDFDIQEEKHSRENDTKVTETNINKSEPNETNETTSEQYCTGQSKQETN